jgi:hypothetical protein
VKTNNLNCPKIPDEVFEVALHLGMSLDETLDMPYREFKLWVDYFQRHPSLERIVDIHLSKLLAVVQKNETIENMISITQEQKDELLEQIKQNRLLEELKNFK